MIRTRLARLSEEKKKLLLAAAAEDFAHLGFEGASFNQIIKTCGLSKGSVYYYFEDKEDLFLHVFQDALATLKDALLLPPLPEQIEAFWTTFRAASLRFFLSLSDHPRETKLLRAFLQARPFLHPSPALLSIDQTLEAYFVGVWLHAVKIGALRDDLPFELLLLLLNKLTEGGDAWLLRYFERFSLQEIEAYLDVFLDLLRRAFAPPGLPAARLLPR